MKESKVKKYTVNLVYDASCSIEIESKSIEDAIEAAYDEISPSLCHYCARDLNIGDHLGTVVCDEDDNEVYNDL